MAYKTSKPKSGATKIKHGKSGGTGFVTTKKTEKGTKTTSYDYPGNKKSK